MSLLVISGDLKHAGSANPTDKRTRKFFLYLDPLAGVRERAVKNKKYGGGYVYFNQYQKTVEKTSDGAVMEEQEAEQEEAEEEEEVEEEEEEEEEKTDADDKEVGHDEKHSGRSWK